MTLNRRVEGSTRLYNRTDHQTGSEGNRKKRRAIVPIVKGLKPELEQARDLAQTDRGIERVYGHHPPYYLIDAAKSLDW